MLGRVMQLDPLGQPLGVLGRKCRVQTGKRVETRTEDRGYDCACFSPCVFVKVLAGEAADDRDPNGNSVSSYALKG